jgi:hypothetical protein
VTVSHRSLSRRCAINFVNGKSYTLAARRSENSRDLSTSRCSSWSSNARFTAEFRAARQRHATPLTMSPQPAR